MEGPFANKVKSEDCHFTGAGIDSERAFDNNSLSGNKQTILNGTIYGDEAEYSGVSIGGRGEGFAIGTFIDTQSV